MSETVMNSYFSPTTPITDRCVVIENIEQKQRSEQFCTVWQNHEQHVIVKTDGENKKD